MSSMFDELVQQQMLAAVANSNPETKAERQQMLTAKLAAIRTISDPVAERYSKLLSLHKTQEKVNLIFAGSKQFAHMSNDEEQQWARENYQPEDLLSDAMVKYYESFMDTVASISR